MKKILIAIYLLCHLGQLSGASAINRLMGIKASAGEHASQIVFEFVRPLYYEKEVLDPAAASAAAAAAKKGAKEEIVLYFPGMNLADFHALEAVKKIKMLPMVKSIGVTFETVPVGRVAVKIRFEKGQVLLRVTKMEDPNLLVIDIFDKEVLEALRRKVTTTLFACNDVNGALPCLASLKKKRILQPRKAHIVIDAGHGGKDCGARAFGLKEKSFTIDIARRACVSLRKQGYRVFLTRNADEYLSIDERIQLARQLKADLFVSVHVNAVGGLQHVSGVETYFFDGAPYFSKQGRRTSFLFAEDKYDEELVQVAEEVLRKRICESQNLSNSIQRSLLSCLKANKVNLVNRGVKRAGFGVLSRNDVPASLVEVGFLTNKQEAKRLTQTTYRDWLAQGICNGIKQFLHSQCRAHRGKLAHSRA